MTHPEVKPHQCPEGLNTYGKSIWNSVLEYLKSDELSPADYVLLEVLCHTSQQLRDMNKRIAAQPVIIMEGGMMKPNPLQWNAQALSRTLAQLTEKLQLSRSSRDRSDSGSQSRELIAFLRGES
jgi:P27 family predicted phage terminase small subunit